MNYLYHLIIYLSVYTIAALGLNLVVGYMGFLTLAHAGYYALGAYACALAMIKLQWSFMPAMALGVGLAIILSLAITIPAWRSKGDAFVLVTIAVQTCLFGVFDNWYDSSAEIGTLRNLTNGTFGIPGVPHPDIFGLSINSMPALAAFALCAALGCAGVMWLLMRSPWGRMLRCIRDDELAARSLGKRVRPAKAQAVGLACGLAAIAGAIQVSYVGFIDPSSASLDMSIVFLSMVLLGGSGNFRGPVVGAVIMLLIPEALRFLDLPDAVGASIRVMLYGAMLILLMHIRPHGVAGDYRVE